MARSVTLEFKGGEKLTRLLKRMSSNLHSATGVSVGVLADAKYPAEYKNRRDHRISTTRSITSVATVAFIQEFGSPKAHIPPRPFMRTTIAEKSPKWGDSLAYVLKAHKYNSQEAFTSMGIGIQGQIKATLAAWTDPANAALTVKIKGFNKPLTDEGILHNSIDYEVLTK